ncbi:MAG: hypothetical protein ACR2L2_15645, partial [Acidobacteriota bacterium]
RWQGGKGRRPPSPLSRATERRGTEHRRAFRSVESFIWRLATGDSLVIVLTANGGMDAFPLVAALNIWRLATGD